MKDFFGKEHEYGTNDGSFIEAYAYRQTYTG